MTPSWPQSSPDALVTAASTPLRSQCASLWLFRHAEVAVGYQAVFGGKIDMELSPNGQEQAEALARYLNPHCVDVLYASPMRRVQQTVAPCLEGKLPAPRIEQDLREVDFGIWTGCTWDEVLQKFGVSPFEWLEQLEAGAIPDAESGPSFRARLFPVLKRIVESHSGQHVGIACHGGVIRMLLAILFDLPFPRAKMFEVDYASISLIRFRNGGPQLHLHNFAPWRDL